MVSRGVRGSKWYQGESEALHGIVDNCLGYRPFISHVKSHNDFLVEI